MSATPKLQPLPERLNAFRAFLDDIEKANLDRPNNTDVATLCKQINLLWPRTFETGYRFGDSALAIFIGALLGIGLMTACNYFINADLPVCTTPRHTA